jgi:Lon protease-like protein
MPVQKDQLRRDDESAFQVPERIPVFPLPSVVLFPNTYLPLHIFEPRYREMVADAAAQGQCIGMALLKEGWEEDYYRNPPIFQLGCVGRLVSQQRLPDGRLNILLCGLHRYEIMHEFHDKSYREAAIALKPLAADHPLDVSLRDTLVKAAKHYLGRDAEETPWRHLLEAGLVNDETLLNGLSSCLDFTTLEKQFLLEAHTVQQQAFRLRELIQLKTCGPEAEG